MDNSFKFFSLHGLGSDTKIPLLTGEILTIKEIAEYIYSGVRDLYILSWNSEYNVFEPDLILDAFSIGKKHLNRIHLDNNNKLDCTSNCCFLDRDCTPVSLDSGLKKDITSFLPYNVRITEGYFDIYNPIRNSWYKRYKIVSESLLGRKPYKYHTHHIDFNKKNDSPENLVYLSCEEHNRIHSNSASDVLIRYNKSNKGREKSRNIAEYMRDLYMSCSQERKSIIDLKKKLWHIKKLGYESPEYIEILSEIHKHEIEYVPVWKEDKGKKIEYQGRISTIVKFKRGLKQIKEKYGEDSSEFISMLNFVRHTFPEYNHYVTKIEKNIDENLAFDLIVEKNHNFTLENGIVAISSI